jgi:hypothetical protein
MKIPASLKSLLAAVLSCHKVSGLSLFLGLLVAAYASCDIIRHAKITGDVLDGVALLALSLVLVYLFVRHWMGFYYITFAALCYTLGYCILELVMTKSSEMEIIEIPLVFLLLVFLRRERKAHARLQRSSSRS